MNLNALPKGRDRAIPIGELAESLRVSRRSMEQKLQALADSGVPIVACERGVYITESPQEAREYAASLRGRTSAIHARATALEKWADSRDTTVTQETLWAA